MDTTEAEYAITAPGLTNAIEAMGRGAHVHLTNEDDPDDRMCSNAPPCDGYDLIYLANNEPFVGERAGWVR